MIRVQYIETVTEQQQAGTEHTSGKPNLCIMYILYYLTL